MKRERQFFAAITVSAAYWEQVKHPDTRMEAVKRGYMGQNFGLEPFDHTILPKIEGAETPAVFAQKYLELKKEETNK